jgi:hypothetical protein
MYSNNLVGQSKRARVIIETHKLDTIDPADQLDQVNVCKCLLFNYLQFVDVKHSEYSGLEKCCRIFLRNDVVNLWVWIDKPGNCFVSGAPGTGKSTLIWHWCTYKASQVD